jgi:hypothetical protein
MSIFDEVSSNKKDNNYPYYKYIYSPDQLGASSQGNLTALGNDINALTSYVDVLVTGQSSAQAVAPLGNKYFLTTGATCKDPQGTSQSRYVYINNVPDGDIPLISSAMGQDLTNYEGLVPGVLEDLSYINPLKLFTAFSKGTNCQQITMETIDISNNVASESQYVLDDEIQYYNQCWFPDNTNPVTQATCQEGMQMPKDPIVQTYATCVGLLGIYIAYQLLKK